MAFTQPRFGGSILASAATYDTVGCPTVRSTSVPVADRWRKICPQASSSTRALRRRESRL